MINTPSSAWQRIWNIGGYYQKYILNQPIEIRTNSSKGSADSVSILLKPESLTDDTDEILRLNITFDDVITLSVSNCPPDIPITNTVSDEVGTYLIS